MKYGSKGTHVRRIQEKLIRRGYQLPKHGVDGHLGDETWGVLQQFAEDTELLNWNPSVPSDVIRFLDTYIQRPITVLPPRYQDIDAVCYDLRKKQSDPPAKSNKFKLIAGKVVRRSPRLINGITIHQTAVKYSVAKYQIDAVDGDQEYALACRALDVACHAMAFHDGFYVLTNPLDWYVYHGNGFNSTELGIEIDGNYPGLIGGETWNQKPATEVTDSVINAACAAIENLVREGRKMGMPIQYIHAHRQSSGFRRADPGEELWKRVVLDFCVPKLGLRTQPRFTSKDGRPIPKEWDKDGLGSY